MTQEDKNGEIATRIARLNEIRAELTAAWSKLRDGLHKLSDVEPRSGLADPRAPDKAAGVALAVP